jgi:chaperonin cofactor prefoldin
MKARRKARTSAAGAQLRKRQAKLDVRIARGKRSIKALTKKLKKATAILGRREKARKRMK